MTIRKLKIALLAAGLILAACLGADADPAGVRWYVAHMGGEACVPLDDIGQNLERLYYGTGSMHIPEDLERLFQSVGMRVTTIRHDENLFAFRSVGYDGKSTNVLLFSNVILCKQVMATVER